MTRMRKILILVFLLISGHVYAATPTYNKTFLPIINQIGQYGANLTVDSQDTPSQFLQKFNKLITGFNTIKLMGTENLSPTEVSGIVTLLNSIKQSEGRTVKLILIYWNPPTTKTKIDSDLSKFQPLCANDNQCYISTFILGNELGHGFTIVTSSPSSTSPVKMFYQGYDNQTVFNVYRNLPTIVNTFYLEINGNQFKNISWKNRPKIGLSFAIDARIANKGWHKGSNYQSFKCEFLEQKAPNYPTNAKGPYSYSVYTGAATKYDLLNQNAMGCGKNFSNVGGFNVFAQLELAYKTLIQDYSTSTPTIFGSFYPFWQGSYFWGNQGTLMPLSEQYSNVVKAFQNTFNSSAFNVAIGEYGWPSNALKSNVGSSSINDSNQGVSALQISLDTLGQAVTQGKVPQGILWIGYDARNMLKNDPGICNSVNAHWGLFYNLTRQQSASTRCASTPSASTFMRKTDNGTPLSFPNLISLSLVNRISPTMLVLGITDAIIYNKQPVSPLNLLSYHYYSCSAPNSCSAVTPSKSTYTNAVQLPVASTTQVVIVCSPDGKYCSTLPLG